MSEENETNGDSKTEAGKAAHSAIDRLERILEKVNQRLKGWCEATMEWFHRRGAALKDGLGVVYGIVKNGTKNGANGHLGRIERALERFKGFADRHSPIDAVILAGLVSVIIALVIVARRV